MAIILFKVIQGQQFPYQQSPCATSCSSLTPVLHHFRDMADYLFSFRCWWGAFV